MKHFLVLAILCFPESFLLAQTIANTQWEPQTGGSTTGGSVGIGTGGMGICLNPLPMDLLHIFGTEATGPNIPDCLFNTPALRISLNDTGSIRIQLGLNQCKPCNASPRTPPSSTAGQRYSLFSQRHDGVLSYFDKNYGDLIITNHSTIPLDGTDGTVPYGLEQDHLKIHYFSQMILRTQEMQSG